MFYINVLLPLEALVNAVSDCHTNWFFNIQGKKNPGTDEKSVMSYLCQVRFAKEMKIDR